MARYGEHTHPVLAAHKYRFLPGNYILHFTDGSAYCGRQSSTSNRIGAHVREHGPALHSVQFMRDHDDDECVRAAREKNAVSSLLNQGFHLRNRVSASHPSLCGLRRH